MHLYLKNKGKGRYQEVMPNVESCSTFPRIVSSQGCRYLPFPIHSGLRPKTTNSLCTAHTPVYQVAVGFVPREKLKL